MVGLSTISLKGREVTLNFHELIEALVYLLHTCLRKYELGEYGLQEAVAEVDTLKRQAARKDKNIEELTEQTNSLHYEAGLLHEENNELRDKLGMERRTGDSGSGRLSARAVAADHVDSNSSVGSQQALAAAAAGRQTDKALMQVLQRELERLEEERIQLKTDNRKLAQQLGQRAAKLGLDAGDLQAIQEYTDALKNRRAGMTGLDGSNPLSVLKLHEGGLFMQKDLEERQKEVDNLRNIGHLVKNASLVNFFTYTLQYSKTIFADFLSFITTQIDR